MGGTIWQHDERRHICSPLSLVSPTGAASCWAHAFPHGIGGPMLSNMLASLSPLSINRLALKRSFYMCVVTKDIIDVDLMSLSHLITRSKYHSMFCPNIF